MINVAIFLGRLTRDPEVRYSQGANSVAVARFSIAVDRRFQREGEPTADFFNCVCFGKTAEFVEKYIKKGSKVVVNGRAENDNYEDKDGNMHYGFRWVIDQVEFADAKKETGEGYMEVPDEPDEIPFAPEKKKPAQNSRYRR